MDKRRREDSRQSELSTLTDEGLAENSPMKNWLFIFQGRFVRFSLQEPTDSDSLIKELRNFQNDAPPCLTKKDFREKFPDKSEEEIDKEWGITLFKRRNRKIVRLMELLNTIENTPRLFVSLTVDRTQRPYKSIKKENKIFNNFKKTLMRHYPLSWFAYKKEYETIPKIHFHLIGTLYSKMRTVTSFSRTESLIKKLWDEANGFSWEFSTDVKPFVKYRYDSYVTNPDKLNNDMHCVALLKGSHMLGLIGGKNVNFHEKHHFEPDDVVKSKFFDYIKGYCLQEGRSLDWFYRQLRVNRGNFAFIPQEVQKEALEKATGRTWIELMKLTGFPKL